MLAWYYRNNLTSVSFNSRHFGSQNHDAFLILYAFVIGLSTITSSLAPTSSSSVSLVNSRLLPFELCFPGTCKSHADLTRTKTQANPWVYPISRDIYIKGSPVSSYDVVYSYNSVASELNYLFTSSAGIITSFQHITRYFGRFLWFIIFFSESA